MLAVLEPLALAAGRRIMEIFNAGVVVEAKPDFSPVTQADRDAEAIILKGLRENFPDIPIIAEEEAAEGRLPTDVGRSFFLVDPLDGTREFVRGNSDFTVNIALVRDCVPVVGIVYAPARNLLYAGRPGFAEEIATTASHEASARRRIAVRECGETLTIVASRSHRTPETDDYIARYGAADIVSVGSSLKFCMLAAGAADLYPRFGRTMQWDTAAGDAVLRAAGGAMRTVDGEIFRYGSGVVEGDAPFANPNFIAEGRLGGR
ncbi:3'(2'),5'-bisphosphate nucleotidase CysQ [Aquamicrobium sp. LC103]|nr:3'(2'),5'-bisphosphate nucleotidase CysQ [Aquamicrobium sp. LC103]